MPVASEKQEDVRTVRLGGGGTLSIPGATERPLVDEPTLAFDAARDRFEEHGELGRGGMGRVVDMFDRALARHVAVKHMLANDAAAVRRFDREARITAQLEHPGIVPIYEAGRTIEGTPYYIMRCVDGRPLAEMVKTRESVADRVALVPNVLAACDAVAYAHARTIIHRDLKPANILLGPFGETLVIDWGLACRLDDRDNAESETVAGTPGYMAPEQARGEPLDERADVFALGATLFYVMTGEAPHEAERATAVVANSAADHAPAWGRLPAETPDDLRAIMMKALAIAPADRYPNAAALAADLRRFVTGNLVAARHYTRFEQLRRWVRRHKAIVGVALASVVLVATVTAIAFTRIVAERDEAQHARKRASDRADELAIEKAKRILDGDPTLAVKTIAPLVTRYWRVAYDIAAQAKARGVAWRLPGSAESRGLAITRDGLFAISVGDDGVIRRYDIGARTTSVVGQLAPEATRDLRVEMFDAKTFAVFAGRELTVHDANGQHTIALEHPARKTASTVDAVYWIGDDFRAWQLARTASVPVQIWKDVEHLSIAPDGKSIALGGASGAFIVSSTDAPPAKLVDEPISAVAWDVDGNRVFAITRAKGQVLTIDPKTLTVTPGSSSNVVTVHLVAAGGDIYAQRPDALLAGKLGGFGYGSQRGIGLATLRDEIVAAGVSDGRVSLHHRKWHHSLFGAAPIDRFVGSGSTILAATRDAVLVWNIDDVIPRHIPLGDPVENETAAGPHHVLDLRTPTRWIDLWTRAIKPGPSFVASPERWAAHHAAAPALSVVVVEGTAFTLVPNTPTASLLAKRVEYALVVDDKRVLYARDDGTVVIYDTSTRDSKVVLPAGPLPRYARAAGDYVALVYPGRRCVRIHLPSGRTSELANGPGDYEGHLTADGTMWFFREREIHAWRADGTDVVHATLPLPIRALYLNGDRLAADITEAGYLVSITDATMTRTIPFGTNASMGHGLILVPNEAVGAKIVDIETGDAWPFAQAPIEKSQIVKLSADGTTFYERRTDGLWVMPIDSPVDAATTQRFIAQLVN